MPTVIYADHAATSPLDKCAFDAMVEYMRDEYGNPSQTYDMGRRARKAVDRARESIARCIGASPEEIAFTSGGTESNNWVIQSGAAMGRAVVVSTIEHPSIWHTVQRIGAPHRRTPIAVDRSGIVDIDLARQAMNDMPRPGIVSVMTANNETGVIEPIEELSAMAHRYGHWMHTDAVQAVGHLPIDVKKLDVDMLSASAHKFNGPRGIGFLYIRDGIDIESFIDGGDQEHGRRAGTENVAAIVGMAAALQNNVDHIEENSFHLRELENIFKTTLSDFGVDCVQNGSECKLPGLLSMGFEGASGEGLMHLLDLMGICVSTGSACDSVKTRLSRVLTSMQIDESLVRGTIRISFGKSNTIEEVRRFGGALAKALKIGR